MLTKFAQMNKPKKIIAILLAVLILLTAIVGAIFLFPGSSSSKDDDNYAVKYAALKSKSVTEQIEFYQSLLKVQTSPTELRYVLQQVAPKATDSQKDEMVAQYLSHIQYFANVYGNVTNMYANIITELQSTIDFSTRDSAYQITDKVLRSLLLEIYDNNLYMVVPDNGSDIAPMVLIDYETLGKDFASFIGPATKAYIEAKLGIQDSTIADENGNTDYDSLENIITTCQNFIVKYPKYQLVDDVAYMYSLAAKMYLGTYDAAGSYEVSEELITRYKEFAGKNPETPIDSAIEAITAVIDTSGTVTTDMITAIENSLYNDLGY